MTTDRIDGAAVDAVPAWQRADHGTVRRSNLALVLRHLRDRGARSRAEVAADTGLNKATVSSLVGELVDRGLVREGDVKRAGAVGRPGQALELAGKSVCGIGLEVNVDYIAAIVVDLAGEVLFDRRVPVDVPAVGPQWVCGALADLIETAAASAQRKNAEPVGATVAVPGLVDVSHGVIRFAPNLGWHDVRVADELTQRVGHPAYPISVDNDANLSALAEYSVGVAAGTPDLLYLTGEVGVGAGLIVAGALLRGAEGFSGEAGHLPVDPSGQTCGCGRSGCWETMVGLAALLRYAADSDDPVCDAALDLEKRLTEIERRAQDGDARTMAALTHVGVGLGIGASILVNLFNPRVIVLGGYFARLGPYLLGPAMSELRARVVAPDIAGSRVELSDLGFTAAVRGGAQVALEAVFRDPTIVASTAHRAGVLTSARMFR